MPRSGKLIQSLSSPFVPDCTPYRIVRSAKVTFDLKLDVGNQAILGTSYFAMIAQLIFHLAEQDASCVHIWLRQETGLLVMIQAVEPISVLSFSSSRLPPIHEPQDGNAFHQARS